MLLSLTIFFVICSCANGQYGHEDDSLNLFENSGFEDRNDGHWVQPSTARVVLSRTRCFEGRKCAFIDGTRANNKDTIRRTVKGSDPRLKPNSFYYLSAFVRLTSRGSYSGAKIRLFYEITYEDNTKQKANPGILPYQVVNGRWKQVGGDLKTQDKGIKKVEVWVQLEPLDAEHYLDAMAFTEIPSMGEDCGALDEDIKKHRTSTLEITTTVPRRLRRKMREVQVKQLSLGMQIGVGVKPRFINGVGELYDNYRQFLIDHAQFATPENSLKWRSMESSRGYINYNEVPEALEWLLGKGIDMHGHAILWEPEKRNPNWLGQVDGNEFRDRLYKRIDDMLDKFGGDIASWDLLNEGLQSNYYSKKTGDPEIYSKLFKRANEKYDDGMYCLSDYLIARQGWFASAIRELVFDLEKEGGKPDCIGVQSHIRLPPISCERLAKRIEMASLAEVPIIITEMTVHSFDMDVRTENTVKALKVYYANPWVDKVNFWGFSDVEGIRFTADTGFTTGTNFEPNEVGIELFKLIDGEWNSSTTYKPATWREATQTLENVHHGKYEISLVVDGTVLDSQIITIDKSAAVHTVTLA